MTSGDDPLLDELERLWSDIDAGTITEEDAAHRVVQHSEAATDLEGARDLICHRGQARYARAARAWRDAHDV